MRYIPDWVMELQAARLTEAMAAYECAKDACNTLGISSKGYIYRYLGLLPPITFSTSSATWELEAVAGIAEAETQIATKSKG
jgi:hypothetical protein